ncbi:hypothetical protein [Pseudomonas sp. 37 R 15]|uniref:hypothetical protein n=1 Tax=Pseudomonas sp. 37 R 15 TaxID=1844104 RepID=UPI0008129BE7|nr:hypothetical protein [Pseudomonas sp. 37 R 15]CRM31177.1 hypothetical protein [Pseudomonas sp. 37 R 15]
MEQVHTTDEVFGITRQLPLNYVERLTVDKKLREELDAGHHIVIYGSSKQGKTSLRKHCLNEENYILVQCSNKSDMADLHASILKRAGFEITQSSKKSSTGRNKVLASAKAGVKGSLFGFGASGEALAGAEGETGTGNEITTAPLELDIDDVNDVIAALSAVEFKKQIVLEDFHYLPYEIQRDFSVELKAFHESSDFTFIIVGVWLEDNRLIVYNGDLTGRVISVNADRWSEGELKEVVDSGGHLLGVSFDNDFSNKLISIARESVYIVQEACRRACIDSGIKSATNVHSIIGNGIDVVTLVKSIVDQQSARYDGFLTNFADGFQETELEMHKWLLYPILSAPIEDLEKGLKYRDIKNTLFEKHPRQGELNPGNITQSLQSSASLQVKKNIMPIIVDYDQSSKTLHIVDKGFLIWLQHQDVAELLSDVGLPN